MQTQSYNNFWQRIHQSAREKAFPLRVMFELTYRCNFKCRHCYVPYSYRKKGELKTKEVIIILDQLAQNGCFYLGFTGGEPFMRKDIIDILWHAKRKGFELIVYTNGSLINEEIAKELQRLRLNKVDITIPAMNKTNFERITGVVGSYKKVFKTIGLLSKNGVNLGFKTCVLKENETEVKEIQDFAASLGALHRLDDILSPRLDGSQEPYRYRGTLKNNRVTGHRSQVTGKGIINGDLEDCNKKTMDYGPSTMDLFKCGVGISQAAITPLGELKMCLMIDYPKYRIVTRNMSHVTRNTPHAARQQKSLEEAWKRLQELVNSIKPDKDYQCDRCGVQPYCKWCPARSWLYKRSFTVCEPESYKKAEFTKQSLNC